jgi:hypothetical protein
VQYTLNAVLQGESKDVPSNVTLGAAGAAAILLLVVVAQSMQRKTLKEVRCTFAWSFNAVNFLSFTSVKQPRPMN